MRRFFCSDWGSRVPDRAAEQHDVKPKGGTGALAAHARVGASARTKYFGEMALSAQRLTLKRKPGARAPGLNT